MSRQLHQTHPETLATPLPINWGGTGKKTAPEALVALTGVSSSLIGQPDGITPLDQNAKVPLQYLPPIDSEGISFVGPSVVYSHFPATFYISDFDTNRTYDISCSAGTFVVDDKDSDYAAVILYTPPAANTEVSPGVFTTISSVTITVNGQVYTIQLIEMLLPAPSVTTGPNNNEICYTANPSFVVVRDPVENRPFFLTTNNVNYVCFEWQIAENIEFTTNLRIFDNYLLGNRSDNISIPVELNKNYFLRVRYRIDNELVPPAYVSPWCVNIVSFSTSDHFIVDNFSALLSAISMPELQSLYFGQNASISPDRAIVAGMDITAIFDTMTTKGVVNFYKQDGNDLDYYQHVKVLDAPESTYVKNTVAFGIGDMNGYFGTDVIISQDKQKIFITAADASQSVNGNVGLIYIYKLNVLNDYNSMVVDQILEPPTYTGAAFKSASTQGQILLSDDENTLIAVYSPGYLIDAQTDTAPLGCIVIYKKVAGSYVFDTLINHPDLADYRTNEVITNFFGSSISGSSTLDKFVVRAIGEVTIESVTYRISGYVYEKVGNAWELTYTIKYNVTTPGDSVLKPLQMSPDGLTIIDINREINSDVEIINIIPKLPILNWTLTNTYSINNIPESFGSFNRGQNTDIESVAFGNNVVYFGLPKLSHQTTYDYYAIEEGEDGVIVICNYNQNGQHGLSFYKAIYALDYWYNVGLGGGIYAGMKFGNTVKLSKNKNALVIGSKHQRYSSLNRGAFYIYK